jgi:hypothetical protein
MTISHDCAQVERDAISLHLALTEAVRRMSAAARVLRGPCLTYELGVLAEVTLSTADLLQVLTQTAEPGPWLCPHTGHSTGDCGPQCECTARIAAGTYATEVHRA